MNGNKHLTWTIFTYILGGLALLAYTIFKMNSENVSAQIKDLKDTDKGTLSQYAIIMEQIGRIQIDIAEIKGKLGIPTRSAVQIKNNE